MAKSRSVYATIAALTIGLASGVVAVSNVKPAWADPPTEVSTVVSGLTIPWDLTWVGDVLLYDIRGGQIWSKRDPAPAQRVDIDLSDVFDMGEAGLLGIVADPAAASNKLFYTCQAVRKKDRSAKDVRVLRWKLDTETSASLVGSPVVTGLPLEAGRHAGCRLRFGADGRLYIGTGDAAVGTNAQSKRSLGGKILRVNANGTIPRDNPFYSRGGKARYIWNYGHRNVQGLALRPGTTQLWSAEHGTYRDDEINQSVKGANYGWDPIPGYNEARPMTDKRKFPSARGAKWSSGTPTVATSGLTFLSGSAWGRWEGAMATGMLAGEGIKLLFLNPSRQVASTKDIPGLDAYHRIRTVQQGPDGALYFTTSNGGGRDIIGKIKPTAKPRTVAPGTNVATAGVSAVRTGSDLYAFIRKSSGAIAYKHSSNGGRTWGGWQQDGMFSSAAPSVASSGHDRVDLVTRSNTGQVIYAWYVNGVSQGGEGLGNNVTAATISSTGGGRLDVYGLRPDGSVARRHFNGDHWSAWRSLGGSFTSAVGASANVTTNQTLITARGPSGAIYERSLTSGGDGPGWVKRSGTLWSGRALGDARQGAGLVGVSVGSDGHAVLQRGAQVMGLPISYTSDPDVVTRPDGSWIMFGRGSDGKLHYYDGRSSRQRDISLGGEVH